MNTGGRAASATRLRSLREPDPTLFLSLQAKTRRLQLDVSVLPGFVEARRDGEGFGHFVLQAQAAGEAVEGPAIFRIVGQIIAVDGLRVGVTLSVHERSA